MCVCVCVCCEILIDKQKNVRERRRRRRRRFRDEKKKNRIEMYIIESQIIIKGMDIYILKIYINKKKSLTRINNPSHYYLLEQRSILIDYYLYSIFLWT